MLMCDRDQTNIVIINQLKIKKKIFLKERQSRRKKEKVEEKEKEKKKTNPKLALGAGKGDLEENSCGTSPTASRGA